MRPAAVCLLGAVLGCQLGSVAWADTAQRSAFDQLAEDFTANWAEFERPNLRLRATDPSLVTPEALDALSEFIDSCAVRLGLTDAQRASLRSRPIRYYLCRDPHEVHFLGGLAGEGVALPEYRAIVSRWLPHEHEVVHVLADLAVGGAGLSVEPVLAEGLASLLGGRAGESPAVVLTEADEFLGTRFLSPHALWGAQRFRSIPVGDKVVYAVSARFVQFLVDRLGMPRFLALYRLLAATPAEVRDRPRAWVLAQLEGELGAPWEDLVVDFERWRLSHPPSGIEAVVAPQDSVPPLEAIDDGRRARLWLHEDGSLSVVVQGQGRNPSGLVQWGEPIPRGFVSRLRTRHAVSARRRYGVWMSPDRVELYDYVLDKTLATLRPSTPYITGIGDVTPAAISVRMSPELMRSIQAPRRIELVAPPTLRE